MSKNNPNNRAGKKQEYKLNGKKVVPALYRGKNSKYMTARFEDTTLVMGRDGEPVKWNQIRFDAAAN